MKIKHTILLFVTVLLVTSVQAQDTASLLTRINGLRSSLGLQPYNRNGLLDIAAANHAAWMIETGQVSHSGQGGSTPRSRAANVGYVSQWVSENIYGGTNATTDVAWNFWINSSIHYRGLTSSNYQDVGIGSAQGSWGNAYVLLFGNSIGGWDTYSGNTQNTSSGGGNSGGNAAAPAPPPIFIVGVDTVGNIMHEIQPGDTLGDIALLYGYTWDDLPYMRDINDMNEQDSFDLEIGAVFLVPPQAGTYTPTPGEPTATSTPAPTETPEPSPTPDEQSGDLVESVTIIMPTTMPTHTPNVPRIATAGVSADLIATLGITPTITATPLQVADANLPDSADVLAEVVQPSSEVISQTNRRPVWFMIALGLQVVMVIGAGFEMIRRFRR